MSFWRRIESFAGRANPSAFLMASNHAVAFYRFATPGQLWAF